MTWFKVDDGFWSHPKVVALSDAAVKLWVRAGSYSCQHLTDGHIAGGILPLLGTEDAARELASAGLWNPVDDGFEFHDWGEYQETSEAVKNRREAARDRQRRRREQRENKRVSHADVTPSVTRDIPSDSRGDFAGSSQKVFNPRPDPTRPDQEPPNGGSKRGSAQATALPRDWQPDAELVADMRAECPGVDLEHETRKFVDYWIAVGGTKGRKKDWRATWRNWIRRASESAPKAQRRENTLDAWSTPAGSSQPLPTFVDAEVVEMRRALP